MEYRKDIQILRGIAVLLVVLFHLELAGFRSGFLGVDVFFVISGYLMAMMYRADGKLEFFAKRARRLLPAYFATILATLIAAAAITKLNDYWQVASQVGFASVFASNVGFWLEDSYFDKELFRPLLHLWSLGVEIQFYLLVPALAWVFGKSRFALPALIGGSALACFVMVAVLPNTAFYWLPFRLWEFLLGFGVARHLRSTSRRPAIGAAGLALIVGIPFVQLQGTAQSVLAGHPGLAALAIALATSATLVFGLPRRVLATPVATLFERLGGASYSIYLAHFPVIVLGLYQPFSGTVLHPSGTLQAAMLLAAVAIASVLLYHLVEQPFRRNARAFTMVIATSATAAALAPLGAIAQRAMIPEQERLIYEAWWDKTEKRCGKFYRVLEPTSRSCRISRADATPSTQVMLLGDSHANAIKQAFTAAAESRNVGVRFFDPKYDLRRPQVLDEIVSEAVLQGARAIVVHYSPRSIDAVGVEGLTALAGKHSIEVALILPVPTWTTHLPKALWKSLHGIEPPPRQTLADYERQNAALIAGVRAMNTKPRVYPVAETLCKDVCRTTDDAGKPLYFDSNHLTNAGSALLGGVFNRVIDDLSSKTAAFR